MDWLDLLAVQGTLKSLLQYHSSKASILWHSAFFIVQHSHPNMTAGKTIALTRWTFVGKIMSLLFTMLSRLVITFLPMSKCLLISWLQLPSVVIMESPKLKSVTVSTVSPSVSHKVILSMVPCAIQQVFGVYFIYANIYLLIQNSSFIPHLSLLVTISLCSMSMSLFLFCK